MGMKHYSYYNEDWSFGIRMAQKYHNHISENAYRHVALSSWEIASCPMFYLPYDYSIWFNANYGKHRNVYPVCYIVAMDDVIPVHICPEPYVLLQNPDELKYVMEARGDIIRSFLPIIKLSYTQAIEHWHGRLSNYELMCHVSNVSDDGWKFYPDILDHHTPTSDEITILSSKED